MKKFLSSKAAGSLLTTGAFAAYTLSAYLQDEAEAKIKRKKKKKKKRDKKDQH